MNGDISENASCERIKRLTGRIKSYFKTDGYGFIHTQEKKDLFFSSYQLGKLEDKIRWGASVRFSLSSQNGRPIADNIEIVEKYPNGDRIMLPGGRTKHIKAIQNVSYYWGDAALSVLNVERTVLIENGWSDKQFECIIIRLKTAGPYIYVDEACPDKRYRKANIREYYPYLRSFWEVQ